MHNEANDINNFKKSRLLISLLNDTQGSFFDIGRVNYIRAVEPLKTHTHSDCIEIVCMIKGHQHYSVGGSIYQVKSREAFITYPDEPHSSDMDPEEKAFFYYVIFNPEKTVKYSFAGNREDADRILSDLYEIKKRVFSISQKSVDMLEKMIDMTSSKNKCRYFNTLRKNLISEFLIHIVHDVNRSGVDDKFSCNYKSKKYIAENIKSVIPISVLSEVEGVSESRFKARFRMNMGFPPGEYILRKKIEFAKIMLLNTDKSITEIAYEFSFSSSQYFATVFKRFTNTSPSNFRRESRKSS